MKERLSELLRVGLAGLAGVAIFCVLCYWGLCALMGLVGPIGPGMNDWHCPVYEDYEIWHINSENIVLVRRVSETGGEPVLEPSVSAFQHEGSNLGLKTETGYYYMDMDAGRLLGPFSEKEYQDELDSRGIIIPGGWIPTDPAPEGSIFPLRR